VLLRGYILAQVLAPQVRLQAAPVFRRVSERQKERGFEPADRMAAREQVPMQLRRVDDGTIRVRDLNR